jgi:hypothetical protein
MNQEVHSCSGHSNLFITTYSSQESHVICVQIIFNMWTSGRQNTSQHCLWLNLHSERTPVFHLRIWFTQNPSGICSGENWIGKVDWKSSALHCEYLTLLRLFKRIRPSGKGRFSEERTPPGDLRSRKLHLNLCPHWLIARKHKYHKRETQNSLSIRSYKEAKL